MFQWDATHAAVPSLSFVKVGVDTQTSRCRHYSPLSAGVQSPIPVRIGPQVAGAEFTLLTGASRHK